MQHQVLTSVIKFFKSDVKIPKLQKQYIFILTTTYADDALSIFAGTLSRQREEGKGTHGAENSCRNELGSTLPTRKYQC